MLEVLSLRWLLAQWRKYWVEEMMLEDSRDPSGGTSRDEGDAEKEEEGKGERRCRVLERIQYSPPKYKKLRPGSETDHYFVGLNGSRMWLNP